MKRFFLVISALVAACAPTATPTSPGEGVDADIMQNILDSELQAIVDTKDAPYAGIIVRVLVGDDVIYEGAAGCAEFTSDDPQTCERQLTPTSKARIASISKMATGIVAQKMARAGVIDLDRDVSEYLGWPLRHPDYPDRRITTRQLLSHTSSIRDPEAYWLAAPAKMKTAFQGRTDFFAIGEEDVTPQGPGDYFSYANLNYGIVAGVMEVAAGKRFDLLMRDWLFAPMGLDIGFNWSGVSLEARRKAASLYRLEKGVWEVQTDGRSVLDDDLPFFLREDDVDPLAYLEAYVPGDNPTLFSPQGGLRANVRDLTALAGLLSPAIGDNSDGVDVSQVWELNPDRSDGDTMEGFFKSFGLGIQELREDDTPFWGRTLLGHSGEAYGLHSGAWVILPPNNPASQAGLTEKPIVFAFMITGTSKAAGSGRISVFYDHEEPVLGLVKKAVELHSGIKLAQ